VDGVTWQDYEAELESNLQDLHARVQRGAYRALPSRRKYLLKPDGRQRPLGIAALEDKLLQRAVVAVLNPVYEEEFLGFSYGLRPKRSQHDALDALMVGIERKKVNWPRQRFDVTHPRREPSARMGPARFCAGGAQ
jgi:retron-type reverse transcriptase